MFCVFFYWASLFICYFFVACFLSVVLVRLTVQRKWLTGKTRLRNDLSCWWGRYKPYLLSHACPTEVCGWSGMSTEQVSKTEQLVQDWLQCTQCENCAIISGAGGLQVWEYRTLTTEINNKLVSEWVGLGFNVPNQHIIGHFGDESYQSVTCTGTDNLTRTTKRQNTQITRNNTHRK